MPTMQATNKKRYAAGTEISEKITRLQIEELLEKHGAKNAGFMRATDVAYAMQFNIAATDGRMRTIRITLPLPVQENQQDHNGRWRALLLLIKSKLVAVADGITELDDAFMADIVLPNNQTMREVYGPQIAQAYASRQMPKALPSLEK